MGLLGILDGVLELVAPTKCAGCDLPGSLLCDACVGILPRIDVAGACPRCGAPFGWLVCTECWEREWSFTQARCAGELERPLSRMVTLYKDGGERRLARVLAALALEAASDWSEWADSLEYVPATPSARRRRGFDHAEEVARLVASEWAIECTHALERTRARDQRTLDRSQRLANAQQTFTARRRVGGRVVLLDDVFTTGATLDAAASTLLEAGAAEVRVIAIARAW